MGKENWKSLTVYISCRRMKMKSSEGWVHTAPVTVRCEFACPLDYHQGRLAG